MKLPNSLLVAGVLLLAGSAYAAKTQREIIDNAKKFTVLVTGEGLSGGGRGSGVLLDSTHVLTCFHMLSAGDDEFFVYTYPFGRVVKAHPEWGSASDDMVVLVLESSVTVRVKPVFQSSVYDGEPVTVLGNVLGSMKWAVSKGVISGSERQYLLTDATVNPGNSGGPWLNEKGEIVAISNWGIKNAQSVNGGLSGKRIMENFKARERQLKLLAMIEAMFSGGEKPKATK